MATIDDYSKVFKVLVDQTSAYITDCGLKAMVLGISGGIDSTVCAAICHAVHRKTGIPLIGRSLPTHFNKENEVTTSDLVGKAFCNDYRKTSINIMYKRILAEIDSKEADNLLEYEKQQTPIANGNIQARLRMIYLYNLASIHKGLVIDTDNLTEHNLGYWTIHGDVGDFNPIGGLWKTEIFELAKWLTIYYNFCGEKDKAEAISESLKLQPTAGLGITNSDLEELGAESYDQVDGILREILAWKAWNKTQGITFKTKSEEKEIFLNEQEMLCYPIEVIEAVTDRHFASEFKRGKLPVVVSRESFAHDFHKVLNQTYPVIKKHNQLSNTIALFTEPNKGYILEVGGVQGVSDLQTINENGYVDV